MVRDDVRVETGNVLPKFHDEALARQTELLGRDSSTLPPGDLQWDLDDGGP